MKKSNRMSDMTFVICGRMLKTVSRISLICTLDLISLNILIIRNALKIVMVVEKLSPRLKN